ERYIAFPRDANPGYMDTVIAYFQRAGCTLNITHEADNLYTSLALVAAGVGISLFPASLLDVPRKGIKVRKLQPSPPMMGMGVAYCRERRTPVVQSFLNVLAEVVKHDKRSVRKQHGSLRHSHATKG